MSFYCGRCGKRHTDPSCGEQYSYRQMSEDLYGPMVARGAPQYPGDLGHQHQEFTDTTAAYEAGEDVVPGDCWRACLASLLEIPLADVPHFIHLYSGGVGEPECSCQIDLDHTLISERDCALHDPRGPRWWRESVAWVKLQRPGWTIAAWDRPEPWAPLMPHVLELDGWPTPRREILTAPSPRGNWNHSVLVDAQTGELEHDPFPGGTGVLDGPGDRVALVREEWLT